MKKETRISAIDQNLHNHQQERPADVIVHPKLVVTRRSGEAIVKQMKSGKPNKALRDLMGDGN
jgi:hypothetical protein